ncbi:MlaD family protein [Endozoicomonas sp. Mp262]|uniref:MlaD family protein n=1 Tax=Endozoicomonas sp. Mp262 TaxID=2919499 RepID=UPI0021DAB82C
MTKRANPVLIGSFVVGTVALVILFIVLTGHGDFSRYDRLRYELIYDTSIKGLNIGAPVTLRGVKIGEVTQIKARYYPDHKNVLNAVYVDIYPDAVVQENHSDTSNLPEQLIQQGFGAQLKLQSLLTGLLYIEVDLYPNKVRSITVKTDYPQIPTVPSDLESLSRNLDNMDLPGMVADLRTVIKNLRAVTDSHEAQTLVISLGQAIGSFEKMSKDIGGSFKIMGDQFVPMAKDMRILSQTMNRHLPETISELNKVIHQMDSSLTAMGTVAVQMQDVVDPESPMFFQLEQSSKDIGRAARAIESLAAMLEQQPGAIWSGRKEVKE